MKIKQREIERALAAQTNIKLDEARLIIDTLKEIVGNELQLGNQVSFTNFGKFETFVRKSRKGINPKNSNQEIIIPDVRVAKFRVAKKLKDKIKNYELS